MKDIVLALLHLTVNAAKLWGRGGGRTMMAENLLLKQQLRTAPRSRLPMNHVRWVSHCRRPCPAPHRCPTANSRPTGRVASPAT